MKKILFFLLLFSIASCVSNDEQIDEQVLRIIDSKKLSESVISSKNFQKYYKNTMVFFNKFYNKAVLKDMPVDSYNIQLWINQNIDSTAFNDIEDFDDEYNRLILSYNLYYKEFQKEFEYLKENPTEFRIFKDNLLLNIQNSTSFDFFTSSEELVLSNTTINKKGRVDCHSVATSCISAAQENAAAGIAASAVGSFFNPLLGIVGAAVVYIQFDNAVDACVNNFELCMQNQQ